jgi:archaellum component FlaG (FlaF/FlaG flagellin family)
VGIILALPSLTYAVQSSSQNSFTATLNGNVVQPPVNTPATGTAKFQLNSNGTISYEVDAKNLDKVIDGSIEYKNGTEVVSLINPYATTSTGFNQVKSVYPTGLINGKLTSGVITSDKLLGGFLGKNVTDLSKSMKDGSLNVVIRTQPHQDGEIAGTIVPSK